MGILSNTQGVRGWRDLGCCALSRNLLAVDNCGKLLLQITAAEQKRYG